MRFFSQWELWCDDDTCGATPPGRRDWRQDTLGYIDESHLNTAGAMYLWPYLCAAMQ